MAREAEGFWRVSARRCDSCRSSPAVLFCRDDAAYLCGTCDSRVHGANRLVALRHERVRMCEVCEQAPAAFTCKADAATLCVTCDADIHAANPLARRHERFPVVPFYEPLSSVAKPSAAAAAAAASVFEEDNGSEAATWMMPSSGQGPGLNLNPNPKGMMEAPDLNFFADVDPYLDLDYADSLVPVQGKPAAGGGAPPPPATMAPGGVVEIDFTLGKPSYGSYNTHSMSHSVSSSEVGVVPDGGVSSTADVSNPYGRSASAANPTAAMDREARVMRYREKRKNRKFEKTIRYASRKAYAETRPRIKGRFAKRVESESDADLIYPPASISTAIMMDNGYGVVPSF